jgi:hypothetical protein
MDNILQALMSWQFVLFALAIAAFTFVVRKVVEFAIDSPSIPTGKMSKHDRFWTELVLPVLPVVLGGGAGFLAKMYPFPDGITSGSARIAFGLVAGLLSGLIYRIINSMLTSKLAAVMPPVTPEDPGASVRNTINKE